MYIYVLYIFICLFFIRHNYIYIVCIYIIIYTCIHTYLPTHYIYIDSCTYKQYPITNVNNYKRLVCVCMDECICWMAHVYINFVSIELILELACTIACKT